MKKTKAKIHLLYPSVERVSDFNGKVDLDATYVNPKKGLKTPVQLFPQMSMNQGRDVFIDAERFLQIKYTGTAWQGPDPRAQYAAVIRTAARELETRGINWEKYAWPLVAFVFVCLAGMVAMAVVTIS